MKNLFTYIYLTFCIASFNLSASFNQIIFYQIFTISKHSDLLAVYEIRYTRAATAMKRFNHITVRYTIVTRIIPQTKINMLVLILLPVSL